MKGLSVSRSTLVWTVIFVLIASPFVLFQLPVLVGAESTYVVQSGSMEPNITTGSAIWVYGIEEEVEIGDVITFKRGTTTRTTHRVVGTQGSGEMLRYVTKGDANDNVDTETVAPGDVEGRVGFTVPYLGAGLSAATSPVAYLFLVLLPGIALATNESWKVYGEIRQLHSEGEDQKAFHSLLMSASLIMLLSAFTAILLIYPLNLASPMMVAQIFVGGLILTTTGLAAIFWYYDEK